MASRDSQILTMTDTPKVSKKRKAQDNEHHRDCGMLTTGINCPNAPSPLPEPGVLVLSGKKKKL